MYIGGTHAVETSKHERPLPEGNPEKCEAYRQAHSPYQIVNSISVAKSGLQKIKS